MKLFFFTTDTFESQRSFCDTSIFTKYLQITVDVLQNME